MTYDNFPLIDHHCHGAVKRSLQNDDFARLMSESFRPAPEGTDPFLKPLGLVMRKHCAPVLDLDPLAPMDAYLDKRREIGPEEINRRFLKAAGVTAFLVDTGHCTDDLLSPEEMESLSGVPSFEVVRIEAVMETAAGQASSATDFRQKFESLLSERCKTAVGLKSVVAYRCTFAIDQTRPPQSDVDAAFDEWRARTPDGESFRVEDPILVRYGLWAGADLARPRRLPIQLHVGIGDPDVYMHACDPTHFTDFLRDMEEWEIPITLLHNYPFVREAAWLSEIFQNTYYDVGVILHFTGASAQRQMDEALELAPFSKHMFSSDAFGLPEFHYLGALLFRQTLAHRLDAWVKDGACTVQDAEEIAMAISADNARRIYQLDV
ncbi:MAG: amidohydrolase family protein [Pseudomonadota bacterium]